MERTKIDLKLSTVLELVEQARLNDQEERELWYSNPKVELNLILDVDLPGEDPNKEIKEALLEKHKVENDLNSAQLRLESLNDIISALEVDVFC